MCLNDTWLGGKERTDKGLLMGQISGIRPVVRTKSWWVVNIGSDGQNLHFEGKWTAWKRMVVAAVVCRP